MSKLNFSGAIEGYVVNTLAKEYWKVQRSMEWEDVMQEAKLVFWQVTTHYPDVEDKHLMALFKTSWQRRFTDLATKDTNSRHVLTESSLTSDDDSPCRIDSVGDSDTNGMLELMVQQAPNEVRMVLNLLLKAPTELLEMASEAWRSSGKRKAEGNNMINRCLGFPKGTDSLGNVHRYFLDQD